MKPQRVSGGVEVNAGLRQGSAASPLLFIAMVELIIRSIVTKDILRKLVYADDAEYTRKEEAQKLRGWYTIYTDMSGAHSRKCRRWSDRQLV